MIWFPRPPSERNRITVDLNLKNYATKAELKGATGTDLSGLVKKDDFDELKRKVDNIKVSPGTSEETKKDLKDLKDLTGKYTTDISDAVKDIKKLQEDGTTQTKDIQSLKDELSSQKT